MTLSELTPAHKGRRVIYRNSARTVVEIGVIVGWNDLHVFVRYGGDTGSKATAPWSLELVPEPLHHGEWYLTRDALVVHVGAGQQP